MSISACSPVPIYSVANAEYVSVNGKVTLEQARIAIINASVTSRWQIEEIAPGHMTATKSAGNQKAVVDIKYDTSAFGIFYKSSKNLEYDGFNIHQNYNNWMQNLQHNINIEFDKL